MPDENTQPLGDPEFVVDDDQLIDESLPGQATEYADDFFDQDPVELAYAAGQAMASEPPERAHPDACPFPPDSEEHDAWMSGFKHVLEQQLENDPATLIKLIEDRVQTTDKVNG